MTIFHFESPGWLIFTAFAAYMMVRIIVTVPSGVLRVRGGRMYVRADRPVMYWTNIMIGILVCVTMMVVCTLHALGDF